MIFRFLSACLCAIALVGFTLPSASSVMAEAGTGKIGNKIWLDLDANGLQDQPDYSDPAVASVTVNLHEGSPGNIVATTVSAANGDYKFKDLAAGTYYVEVVAPAGNLFSPKDNGASNQEGRDSDVASNGMSDAIVLAEGQTTNNLDAGLHGTGRLGNKIWLDLDGNGLQDQPDYSDPGVGGITVNLHMTTQGNIVATTVSEANGNYTFDNLPPGTYFMEVVLPAGYVLSPKDNGASNQEGRDSDYDPSSRFTDAISVAEGQNNFNVDAGLHGTERLGNKVWLDLDGNGLQDQPDYSDPGVGGVTVNLHMGSQGNVVATTASEANGNYTFDNLPPDTYFIEVVPPGGNTLTLKDAGASNQEGRDSDFDPGNGLTDPINLGPGQGNFNIDAGLHGSGRLGNKVWLDADGNGLQDQPDFSDPGVGGVMVKLHKGSQGNVVATSTSESNGNFTFDNLPPDTYYMEVVTPEGHGLTLKDAGASNQEGRDSDFDPSNGFTDAISLADGESNFNVDSGLIDTSGE